ncbi:Hypothetical predicted protein [Mytilus galloprovincialis]|uniref:Fibrinogen C-terminal domain-containing protein n=1 Tax=Mytilus galloprovincialis TaxID=29158 RepID=A0A8B6GAN3_MYTGA|nr:Hypothetical predicted protein [Mytilus galloprovincialis]
MDEDLKQHIEKMKGNLTLNFEKEIKGYVDGVHQNLTDTLSEGDAMIYSNGATFSTKDKGNACAKSKFGAWWYQSCTHSNLNGEYLRGKTPGLNAHRGVLWQKWTGFNHSLKKSEMMIRKI